MNLPDGLASPASSSSDAACAEQSFTAKQVLVDVLLVVDHSSSMNNVIAGGAAGMTKWMAIRDSLAMFIKDPRSSGLGVGLQYFPPGILTGCLVDEECGPFGPCQLPRVCSNTGLPGLPPARRCAMDSQCDVGATCIRYGGCTMGRLMCTNIGQPCAGNNQGMCEAATGYCTTATSDTYCDVKNYSIPAVGVVDLPTGADPLLKSLQVTMPNGSTPLGVAVDGAYAYLRSAPVAGRHHRQVVVLASDGKPTLCMPQDISSIAAFVAAAKGQSPEVLTYVIGVLAAGDQGRSNLDRLAAEGGTGSAIIVVPGQDLTQQFSAALETVRNATLPCEYEIPSPSGGALDFGKVNLWFTSPTGDVTPVGNVANQAACSDVQGGWYYDVSPAAGTPSHIVTCKTTCAGLRGAAEGKVEIRYGCKTKLIE